jgi:hypothetical protein
MGATPVPASPPDAPPSDGVVPESEAPPPSTVTPPSREPPSVAGDAPEPPPPPHAPNASETTETPIIHCAFIPDDATPPAKPARPGVPV